MLAFAHAIGGKGDGGGKELHITSTILLYHIQPTFLLLPPPPFSHHQPKKTLLV